MRGIELEPEGLSYQDENQDSLLQIKTEETLDFDQEKFKLIAEKNQFFLEKLDDSIKEEGLQVHDRISSFLAELKDKYGQETISNCAFYYILSMRHPIPDTERLDLEDDLIERFIKNGFKESEDN
jgi:hypothetical protein